MLINGRGRGPEDSTELVADRGVDGRVLLKDGRECNLQAVESNSTQEQSAAIAFNNHDRGKEPHRRNKEGMMPLCVCRAYISGRQRRVCKSPFYTGSRGYTIHLSQLLWLLQAVCYSSVAHLNSTQLYAAKDDIWSVQFVPSRGLNLVRSLVAKYNVREKHGQPHING